MKFGLNISYFLISLDLQKYVQSNNFGWFDSLIIYLI
jgi:hypothetical protein